MLAEATLASLRDVVLRYGTPTYAYDCDELRARRDLLRGLLPPSVELLYSLKANASLGLCGLLARWGLGADVASVGELETALAAGFSPDHIQVGGPFVGDETLTRLAELPGVLISIDSQYQLSRLARRSGAQPAILRLRPDFPCAAAVVTGEQSRFGTPFADLALCEPDLHGTGIRVVGFHVFCGSQVLDPDEIVRQLRGGFDLTQRAAEVLGIQPEILNLGGGFGVPYGREERDLDLEPIARELRRLAAQAHPAKIVLELGRYLVAPTGWYLTKVVGHQAFRGREALVVDGGVHQFADLCGLGRRVRSVPPAALGRTSAAVAPTDVLGSLCLPDDVLAEGCLLPALAAGDVLAFPNAGAYGFSAAPYRFLGQPAAAEVAFTATRSELLRAREGACALLDGQEQVTTVLSGDSRRSGSRR